MGMYVFSAEHALDRFLTKSSGETVLLANNDGEMALATAFLENEKEIVSYKAEYSDAANIVMADAVSVGCVSDELLLKLTYGDTPAHKESVLTQQAQELTRQVEKRPLFSDVVNDKLVLVH